MKRKTTLTLMSILLLVLAFSDVAQAYYNPQAGSWISRDPLGNEAFFQRYVQDIPEKLDNGQLEDEISRLRSVALLNLYYFAENNSINNWDKLGLDPQAVNGTKFFRHIHNKKKRVPDEQAVRFYGKKYDGNCGAGAQHETGTDTHDAPNTPDWIRGKKVDVNTPVGTMIARGWVLKNGIWKYRNQSIENSDPNDINHVAQFEKIMNKRIYGRDQWDGVKMA